MAAMDVPANELIGKVADQLKAVDAIKPPTWAGSVKLSSHNERVPEQKDFWFSRCASLLRTMYLRAGPVGVERLRHKYGGRTSHTVARSHHRKAGGKSIRLMLQQLEQAGLVKKEKVGRILTAKGRSLLDKASKKS
ncbi:30S ribosomal protein S19e [Candidatus Micrarchaeota archaeon]|nr:30S ribosomal protein S19e [Candidatus Micrarchaeota archaeon]